MEGFALLYMFSTIFGGLAHVALAGRSTRWMCLIGSAAFVVGGVILSEVFVGTATGQATARLSGPHQART